MAYVPLRIHTRFSPLQSLIEPSDLGRALASRGIKAGAVVDRGVLFGWARARAGLEERGISPIEGAEIEVLFPSPRAGGAPRAYTLTLLCETAEGRKGLNRLLRTIWSEDRAERLRGVARLGEMGRHACGLIALSGGMTGPVSGALARGRIGEAHRAAALLTSIFSSARFFLEASRSGAPAEELVDPFLRRLEDRHGIRRVAVDPVRYLTRDDRSALTKLRSLPPPPGRDAVPEALLSEGLGYLPSAVQMERRYRGDPDVLRRTEEIAERCAAALTPREIVSEKREEGDELIRYCLREIVRLFGDEPNWRRREIRDRFWEEFWRFDEMGLIPVIHRLSTLFRAVRRTDRKTEIFTPLLSGSLIGYLAGLHTINPERINMAPAVADDAGKPSRVLLRVEGDRRGVRLFREILLRKFDRNVSPLILPVPLSQSDRKRLLRSLIRPRGEWSGRNSNRPTRKGFEPQTRENHRPDPLLGAELRSLPQEAIMTYREERGSLLWFDEPEEFWSSDRGRRVQIAESPLLETVRRTVSIAEGGDGSALLREGKWTGLVERGRLLPRGLVRGMKPETIHDIALLLAAGPKGTPRHDLVARIARVRRGGAPPSLQGREIGKVLEGTGGIPLYQEQIVDLIRAVAGFSRCDAAELYWGMRRKSGPSLASHRSLFLRRALDRGKTLPFAERVFSMLLALAPHALSKGEVYPYAQRLRTVAERKSADPTRFALAVLNGALDRRPRLHDLLDGFRREGISLLPPHRNQSHYHFLEEDGGIRMGLALIPGFDREMGKIFLREREENGSFDTVADLLRRLAASPLPRPVLVRLAKAFQESGEVHRGKKARAIRSAPPGGVSARIHTSSSSRQAKVAHRGTDGQIAFPFREMNSSSRKYG